MKIRQFYASVLLLAVSCSGQVDEQYEPERFSVKAGNDPELLRFSAYIDVPQLTRTEIFPYMDSYKTVWGKGDQISVNADPSYFSVSGGAAETVFITSNHSDVGPNDEGAKYVAYYPLSMFSQHVGAAAYLSGDQTRPFGSVPTLPMVAQADSSELHFKYVAGLLKINVGTSSGSLSVSSSKLSSDKALSGNVDALGETVSMTSAFGDAVSNTAGVIDEAGVEMFFVIPGGEYASLNLTLTDNIGAYVTYEIGPLDIAAGQFREVSVEVDPEEYIPDSYIFYTTTDGTAVTPFNMEYLDNSYEEKGALVFEKNVVTIVSNAFDNTDGFAVGTGKLKTVSFPRTLSTIGNYVFRNCYELEELVLPDNGKMLSIGASLCMNCSSLRRVVLPSSLVKINNNAFQNCGSLVDINIPDGVRAIPQNTFAGCSSLSEISLPDSLTAIGIKAFMGTAISEMTVPEGVESLSSQTFQDCSRLKRLVMKRYTKDGAITSFASNALKNCTALEKIVVPEGASGAYKAAEGWSAYETLITEEQ